jgi:hypothetical protein
MSEETPVVTEQPVPVVEAPKEFVFNYQPKDEDGKPLGGLQVIKAASPEEALEKMAAQNSELVKLNRKLNRDIRLGNIIQDQIPQDAPRVKDGQYEINPRPLSADERLQLVQDLNDPEKCDAAYDRMIEARIGNPSSIRQALTETKQRIAAMDAQAQAEAFVRSTPNYFVCEENFLTLANWMIKNDLEPVKVNFKLAFDTLGPKGANVLRERPVEVRQEPRVDPKPEPVVVPSPEPIPATSKLPVSLNRSNSSDAGTPAKQGYTAAEIEKMSGEEYKQKVLIPEFQKQRQAR